MAEKHSLKSACGEPSVGLTVSFMLMSFRFASGFLRCSWVFFGREKELDIQIIIREVDVC